MKKSIFLLAFLAVGLFACKETPSTENAAGEQTDAKPATPTCYCPQSSKTTPSGQPAEKFTFSNGGIIGLCGTKATNGETKAVTYSEFELFACGQGVILTKGGFMGQNSKLTQNGDTLVLTDSPLLPVGGNFAVQETPWTIEKIYFVDGQAKLDKTLNKNGIRKYDAKEIQTVLKTWEAIPASNDNLDEKRMVFVDQLFVACLSGDKKARAYFADLRNKFKGLDAAYAEAYTQLTDKLKDWDNQ